MMVAIGTTSIAKCNIGTETASFQQSSIDVAATAPTFGIPLIRAGADLLPAEQGP